jgi:hypothetical protein
MTSRLTAKEPCRKPSRVVSGRILAAAPLSTRHTVISLTYLLGLLSADGMSAYIGLGLGLGLYAQLPSV